MRLDSEGRLLAFKFLVAFAVVIALVLVIY